MSLLKTARAIVRALEDSQTAGDPGMALANLERTFAEYIDWDATDAAINEECSNSGDFSTISTNYILKDGCRVVTDYTEFGPIMRASK